MRSPFGLFLIFFIFSSLSNASTKTPTKLDYWVLFSGGDARPMQMIVDGFNQTHPNIQVKMKVIKWAEYYKTLNDSMEAKNPPDVAIIHASLVKEYAASDSITNLTDYNSNWSVYQKNLSEIIKYNNSYYAVPLDLHPLVLFYNKKLLRQAGLLGKDENPIIKAGTAGFIDFFKTLKQNLPTDTKTLSTANLDIYPLWIWYSLYSQQNDNGGYIVGKKAKFNNKQGRRALEVLRGLRDSGVWSEPVHDEKGYNLFKYGNSATMISGVWSTWNFEQNKELDFGVCQFPAIFDKHAVVVDSHTMVIPKQASDEKTKAAVEFINWVSANSVQWALAGHVPANNIVTNSKNFREMPNRLEYLKAAQSGVFYPENSRLDECNQAMKRILVDFIKNKRSVDETLSRAETEINRILKDSSK